MRDEHVPALLGELIPRLGARLGLTIHLGPGDGAAGQIVTPGSRCVYFHNTNFDLNGAGATAVADDKEWSAYHLLRMGYPVPDGRVFYSVAWCRREGSTADLEAGYRYAREHLGWPVVVKPRNGRSGAGVAVVGTRREYERAMREIFRAGAHAALVQRRVEGRDYRILVLDGDVLAAYERLPLSVTGDGRQTLGALLQAKLLALIAQGRHIALGPRDYRVAMRLRRIGRTWATVPGAGERVSLLETANGSTGGDAVDLTERIHPEFRALAARLARDAGLRYCGIDLMTPHSIADPLRAYTVIELNAAAALYQLHAMGEPQRRMVEAIVERLLRAAVIGASVTRPREPASAATPERAARA